MRNSTVALFSVIALGAVMHWHSQAGAQEIVGLNVIPHTQSPMLRWRRPPSPELAARFELYFQNTAPESIRLTELDQISFDGQTPSELLEASQWAWHETPAVWTQPEVKLPPGSMMVWKINGHSAKWGPGTKHELQLPTNRRLEFELAAPKAYLSAVTFLSTEADGRLSTEPFPNQLIIHIVNTELPALRPESVQIWVSDPATDGRVFYPLAHESSMQTFPASGILQPGERGILLLDGIHVPLAHVLIEVAYRTDSDDRPQSLWATLKVKSEQFDISGGWIAGRAGGRESLTIEEYLKTLTRMHIDTGQIEEVAGYTDDPELYQRYPFKRFNRLSNLARYDSDELLPTIHAVEFIGEPQFGGGRPVPPQEVWELLEPYRTSRLPTSVTLSEERTWRYYAGLSDYPHYDAYRVIAPAADHWRAYDWNGEKIGWGSPLETIGEMTRSLRELSRPAPIAYWSQGAHHNWGSLLNPRRGSPTPDELRSQAWHGLANRVTSLYWFNLSLKSLVKFPDLIEPITRVNREIRLLDEIFLRGDAFEHRIIKQEDRASWELASIADPTSLLMTVHDLDYQPELETREFQFQQRRGQWEFRLPNWLDGSLSVFAIDEEGPREVEYRIDDRTVQIADAVHVVGIYAATVDARFRDRLKDRLQLLKDKEMSVKFNPGSNEADLRRLQSFLN